MDSMWSMGSGGDALQDITSNVNKLCLAPEDFGPAEKPAPVAAAPLGGNGLLPSDANLNALLSNMLVSSQQHRGYQALTPDKLRMLSHLLGHTAAPPPPPPPPPFSAHLTMPSSFPGVVPTDICALQADVQNRAPDMNLNVNMNMNMNMKPQPGFLKTALSEDLSKHAEAGGSSLPCVLPSGPRRHGEGTQDTLQKIISMKALNDSVVLQITLLVAGFVIGPGGSSIRSIQSRTGCNIRSWSQPLSPVNPKMIRIFTIEGSNTEQAYALKIINAAVDCYKFLAEGSCQGQEVEQRQTLFGVDFFYNPPPKNAAPYAAGIKGDANELKDVVGLSLFGKLNGSSSF